MVWGPSALPTNFIENLSTRLIAGHRAMSGRPRRILSRSGCYASGSVYLLPVWALTAPLAQQFPASGRVSDDCAAPA